MKMISKKIAIYIMVGFLSVTATLNAYSLGVHATGFEWVGGALAFEEAMKWLLASLGIVSAGGMTADYWENHGQEFEDYCTQQSITDTEVANWQLKLCEGIIDKGSECWQAFKDWASSISTSGEVIYNPSSLKSIGLQYARYFNINATISNGDDLQCYAALADDYSADSGVYTYYFTTPGTYKMVDGKIYCDDSTNFDVYAIRKLHSGNNSFSKWGSSGFSSLHWNDKNWVAYLWNFESANLSGTWVKMNFNEEVTDTKDFISVKEDVSDLDIISSPLPDTDAQEVALPMPGLADSDNEASAEAYDNLIDQVNDGTLQLDDAITQVQDILKVIVYEEETEKIFPKPDNDSEDDLNEKINENKDNMAFTLGGLENVFPFCIPWDIYAFMSILEAEPVAPKFQFPFRDPTTKQDIMYEVDLSVFEPVAVVTRYGADLMFIIGLALATRKLIGAGGGD